MNDKLAYIVGNLILQIAALQAEIDSLKASSPATAPVKSKSGRGKSI